MSFIRIKTIKGRRYYYRQTNKRTPNGKVRSVMEYLGPVPDDGQGVPPSPYEDKPGPLRRFLNRFKRDDTPQALDEAEMIWRGWMSKPTPPAPPDPKPIEITGNTARLTCPSPSTSSPSSAPASSPSSDTQPSDSTASTSSPPSSSSSA